jgi:Carboxypeptidase regulatory-like domain
MTSAARALLVTALLAVCQIQPPFSGGVGSIKGIVLDSRGAGIPDAKVYDEPMNSVRIGKDHFVSTDSDGRFVLTDVPEGKAMVIATKTDAGYPDARFALYAGNEVLPIVDVRANQVTSDVVVKLLAKGGQIRGQIVDTQTKRPVPKARITLSRVDHPEWFLETDPESDGTFQFVIPNRAMHFRVQADGYKTWAYEAQSKNREPLKLAPEETLSLDINLEQTR